MYDIFYGVISFYLDLVIDKVIKHSFTFYKIQQDKSLSTTEVTML